MKKVSEAHFQKVLKRQKSANSTKKCSNDNLKSAQTTIFIKRCILTEKVFVNLWKRRIKRDKCLRNACQ